MRKIKYENIIAILLFVFFGYQLLYHYELNGFYYGIIAEIVFDMVMLLTARYIAKDIRKNPTNWKVD